MKTIPTQVDHYSIDQKIGVGSTALIFKGSDIQGNDQTTVAIKLLDARRSELYENEAKFFETVPEHEGILRCYGKGERAVVRMPNSIVTLPFVALEFCQNGDLFEQLVNHTTFPAPIARALFLQMLDALATVHGAGMYHGDIKPENLVFGSDYHLKLTDFGLAGTNSDQITRHRGTLGYMSPEIL
jgi:serine/threonine protein kinase